MVTPKIGDMLRVSRPWDPLFYPEVCHRGAVLEYYGRMLGGHHVLMYKGDRLVFNSLEWFDPMEDGPW